MLKKSLLAVAFMAAFSAQSQAGVVLLAMGELSGTQDLSGLTGTLENGQSTNVLGGLGSGFAWAGGNTFIAAPDRGPNALSYNANVDNTTSYISRVHTLTMDLTSNASGSGLPFVLTPTLKATTLLYSSTALNYGSGAGLGNQINGTPIGAGAPSINNATQQYFTGRSDNFAVGSSTNPNNGRFDPEGVRVSNDGTKLYVSDEYGPYVYEFDRATGERTRAFTLPANLSVTNQSPVGQTEIDGNSTGRVANKGMEGLAITPDGKTLVGIMQAPLEQDKKNQVRIVTVDIATGATHEYGYRLTTGSGVSEIVALNDHEFVIDERDGKGLGDGTAAVSKTLYKIDLNGATDISNVASMTSTTPAVSKVVFTDLVQLLISKGGLSATQIPSKIEGLAFGQDITVNGVLQHTLFVTNDNDFDPTNSGGNKIFVLGFTDQDLLDIGASNYVSQQFVSAVPLPSTLSLMLSGFGVLGALQRRRKSVN